MRAQELLSFAEEAEESDSDEEGDGSGPAVESDEEADVQGSRGMSADSIVRLVGSLKVCTPPWYYLTPSHPILHPSIPYQPTLSSISWHAKRMHLSLAAWTRRGASDDTFILWDLRTPTFHPNHLCRFILERPF